MREGALKESFRMQREIKRAHRFVRSSTARARTRLAIFSSAAGTSRSRNRVNPSRPWGELHRFAPQVEDLDRGTRGRDRSPPLRNPNLRIQLPPRWPLPLRISTQAAGVPHRSAHNVLLSAIFFPAMIASLANSGVKRIA
jgi:hypothetical protein